MPTFRKLTDAEVQEFTRRRNNLEELTEYVAYLKTLAPGAWGSIELDSADSQRTVKRRTSIAATSVGKKIRWRTNRGTPSTLIFQVTPEK